MSQEYKQCCDRPLSPQISHSSSIFSNSSGATPMTAIGHPNWSVGATRSASWGPFSSMPAELSATSREDWETTSLLSSDSFGMDFRQSDPLGSYDGTEIPFPARDSMELFQGSLGDRFPVRDSLELYSNETYSLRCEHSTNGRGIYGRGKAAYSKLRSKLKTLVNRRKDKDH
jgi:hypothetical protein